MNFRTFLQTPARLAAIAILLGTGCSSAPKTSDTSSAPRMRWFAHCDPCNWCKGAFKNSQDAQDVVTRHNKELHDWFRVAYYDNVKCP